MSSICGARRLNVGDFNQEVQFCIRFTLIRCVVHFSFKMDFHFSGLKQSVYGNTSVIFFCVSAHFTSNHHHPFFSCFGLHHFLREISPSLAWIWLVQTYRNPDKHIDRCSFNVFVSGQLLSETVNRHTVWLWHDALMKTCRSSYD